MKRRKMIKIVWVLLTAMIIFTMVIWTIGIALL